LGAVLNMSSEFSGPWEIHLTRCTVPMPYFTTYLIL